jgi:hypothetical protein
MIGPDDHPVQDGADDILTFLIGEFGQPSLCLLDDSDKHMVALLIRQLPLEPGDEGPVIIRGPDAFARGDRGACVFPRG